ncbi:FMN-dependent NADH-azoreductase [Sodalis sp. RH22]|uniref:FMN-dependent NADH-azoreductase n=1 Tax=unclassified Sodalis (in: enterobacteria) TaxID=2636512 RepID=UPI0039B3D8C4
MKLLHLDSSILGANSVSRELSASVVARLTETNPAIQVTYRDLAAVPIPHLSGAYLAAGQVGEIQHDTALQADLALGSEVLEEFLGADTVVLGVGFYNFGIPSQLKAWVDRLAIAGKTFRYTEQGPVGLAGGKRVVIAIARGGFYGPGTAIASFEHAESYLRGIFAFFGIDNIDVVAVEGIAVGPEAREVAITQAEEKIAALHA